MLADTDPAVVLTTTSVTGSVSDYVAGAGSPTVIEVDGLDLDARQPNIRTHDLPAIAYRSTRQVPPAFRLG